MATQVYIGDDMSNPLFVFDGDNILSLVTHTAVNFMPQELTADTADIQVEYDGDGAIQEMNWATQVLIYNDSELFGKFYLTNVKRIGANRYEINAVSIVGLLEYETFYGQRYARKLFKELVEDILLTNGFLYCRFYKAVHRGLFDDDNTVTNRFLPIKFGNVNNYPMNSKTEVFFKLNKFILNDLIYPSVSSSTNVRVALWGNCPTATIGQLSPEQAAAIKAKCYGIYMDVQRATAQDIWPDFGELFFIYGDKTFSLGTPTEPTRYSVSVDPASGTAIINGVTYSITNSYSTNTVDALAWYCGGTISNYNSSGTISSYLYPILCDIEYGNYKLWNSDGAKLVDIIYMENPKLRTIHTNNLVEQLASRAIDFAIFDRSECIFDGGASEWAYKCRENITYGSNVDQILVYGWLPICTKRDALHQLLLATGVIMRKDNDGNVYFTSPTEVSVNQLTSDRIYDEGNQRNIGNTNRIEVTEHIYEPNSSDAREVVFSDSGQHNGVYVAIFQKQPCTSVSFSGLDCLSYNANGAIVIGSGTISAIPTKNTETILHRDIGESKDGRTVSINDATLISLQNSEAVLDRMEAYYGNVYEVENSIVYENEKAGNLYTFTSPFRDQVTGYLAKISSTFSKVIKTACQFICGYNPPGIGQDFTKSYILVGRGTWNLPDFIFEKENPKIRVVLIGGGQGGASGYAGEDGTAPVIGSISNEPAKGGKTGDPGIGGKIYTIDIINPSRSYTYACGEGGEGGAISRSHTNSNHGTLGGDTTFTDGETNYSSAYGESSKDGVTNFFSGDKYAKQVIYYADGGDGGLCDHDGENARYVNAGDVKLGLVKGEYALYNNKYYYNYGNPNFGAVRGTSNDKGCGGGGGGGALTNDPGTIVGTKGEDPVLTIGNIKTGNGGDGGNAEFVPLPALSIKSTYWGYGGQGGAGGGAGGSAGGGYHGGDLSITSGTPGKGGYGGVGGKGGNGCILVYC